MASKLYYTPSHPAGFSTLCKFHSAAKRSAGDKKTKTQTVGQLKAWLEKQDAYTLYRPVRKHFPRNPYTANYVMDVWECDLVDVKTLANLIVIKIFAYGDRSFFEIPTHRTAKIKDW